MPCVDKTHSFLENNFKIHRYSVTILNLTFFATFPYKSLVFSHECLKKKRTRYQKQYKNWWGWSKYQQSSKGESVLDSLLTTTLGSTSAFVNGIKVKVIDLTLATNARELAIRNWRISLERSYSVHKRTRY